MTYFVKVVLKPKFCPRLWSRSLNLALASALALSIWPWPNHGLSALALLTP